MAQAIISAVIVLIFGLIGCYLNIAFCVLLSVASATGCIVYAIKQKDRGE